MKHLKTIIFFILFTLTVNGTTYAPFSNETPAVNAVEQLNTKSTSGGRMYTPGNGNGVGDNNGNQGNGNANGTDGNQGNGHGNVPIHRTLPLNMTDIELSMFFMLSMSVYLILKKVKLFGK